jgi:hypothetical protein
VRTKTLRTTTFRAAVVAVATAVLLIAACGSDDDDEAGTNAGKAAAGDEATTTTETGDASTTTTVASTTTVTASSSNSELASGPDYVTTEGPSGAGCTPGATTTLPDGWWAGEITAVRESAIDLDLVCFFAGDAATKAAEADGQEATDDYYVRNNNARTFQVDFPPGVTPATCAGLDAEPFPCQVNDVLTLYRTTEVTSTSVLDGTDMAPFPLIWVHVTDGDGDYLYMQYTP